jgi:hypothetical protein
MIDQQPVLKDARTVNDPAQPRHRSLDFVQHPGHLARLGNIGRLDQHLSARVLERFQRCRIALRTGAAPHENQMTGSVIHQPAGYA